MQNPDVVVLMHCGGLCIDYFMKPLLKFNF